MNTEYTTDVDTHVKKMQKSLKAKGVTISKKTKASLITVVFHSSFGKEENELFVGHAGVLVPTKEGKLLFVEKLSFSLPYQVIKFDNRKQLYQYLMGMYDTQWGQEEAKPFIMEKNTPHGRHSISCLTPGRCMLFMFPWFQCTEGKRPSRFRSLPPAPWMGACRIFEGTSPVLFL